VPAISRASLVNGILEALTDPTNGKMLAMLVRQAVLHDPKPLQTYLAQRRQREVQDLAMGMHLSVTCAENMPFIAHAAFVIVQAYRRACAVWNVQPVSASFIAPVRSNVPVLMFSGAYDPWTPPYEADEALRYLPNGKHVVIPDAGHDLDRPSLTAQGAAFIDAAGS
jgi:pimeloyl-ACP methyl ester carboxylesterase